jgi:hypothetical protein
MAKKNITQYEQSRRSRRKRRERDMPWQLAEVPAAIIRKMAELQLTPSEFVLLGYLLSADDAWKRGGTISASLREAKKATGLAGGTIHHAKNGLIRKGFMTIMDVRNATRTNTYDFSPMQRKLENIGKSVVLTAK